MQVRASNGTRFFLKKERMEESIKGARGKYFLFRTELKSALALGHCVRYGFLDLYERFNVMTLSGHIEEGITQRNKKFVAIGCMRFVGNERVKLLRWAKA